MEALDLETNWNALGPIDNYTQRVAFSIAYHRAHLRVRRKWTATTTAAASAATAPPRAAAPNGVARSACDGRANREA